MEITLSCCQGSASEPVDARQVLRLLVQAGGAVVDAEGRPLAADAVARDDSNLLGNVYYRHPALACADGAEGLASIGFIAQHGVVSLSQSSLPVDEEQIDPLMRGCLELTRQLYPLLAPRCAWIDEPGSNQPRARDVKRKRLRCLFWATFFGPAYVAALGRSFLLRAPGWKIDSLDDGGILYVPCRSYLHWWRQEPAEVRGYFQNRYPDVRLYRAVQPA